MRNESYSHFLSKFINLENLKSHPRELLIVNVSPYEILTKRFNNYKAYDINLEEWKVKGAYKFLLKFLGHGLQVEPKNVLNMLLEILSYDLRKLMKALQLSFERLIHIIELDARVSAGISKKEDEIEATFLLDERIKDYLTSSIKQDSLIEWKSYDIIDVLTLGSYKYFHNPFNYSIPLDPKTFRAIETDHIRVNSNSNYDENSSLLPNLFGFSENIAKHTDYTKLACLTLNRMNIIKYIVEELEKNAIVYEDDLIEDMLLVHGCHPNLSRAHLHELAYFGAIKKRIREDRKLLYITGTGSYYLNSLLFNFTYLRHVIENSPLPRCLQNEFEVIDYSIDSHSVINAKKIKNVLVFVKYVIESENKCKVNLFSFGEEMKKQILSGVNTIIDAAYKDPSQKRFLDELSRLFSNYITH